MSDYQVTLVNNKMSEFYVKFHGPAESGSKATQR
jgi:ubiquitin-conjugating enzyme E2 H